MKGRWSLLLGLLFLQPRATCRSPRQPVSQTLVGSTFLHWSSNYDSGFMAQLGPRLRSFLIWVSSQVPAVVLHIISCIKDGFNALFQPWLLLKPSSSDGPRFGSQVRYSPDDDSVGASCSSPRKFMSQSLVGFRLCLTFFTWFLTSL